MSETTTSGTYYPYLCLAVTRGGMGGAYGKGHTVEEAKAEAKRHGGLLTRYLVYRLPDGALDAYVGDMAQIGWTWADGADTTARPEEVARRGIRD